MSLSNAHEALISLSAALATRDRAAWEPALREAAEAAPPPRQLHSHLRGALNAGAAPEDVDRALEIAGHYLDAGRADSARALWSPIRPTDDGRPIADSR